LDDSASVAWSPFSGGLVFFSLAIRRRTWFRVRARVRVRVRVRVTVRARVRVRVRVRGLLLTRNQEAHLVQG
jgi:hypothetical protein